MTHTKLFSLLATASFGLIAGVACDVEEDGIHERGADKEYCTLTQGYWKTHNKYAKQPKKQIDWPQHLEDWQMCGQSWLDILHTPTQGSPWYILAHQYIAAKLNVLGGPGWGGDPDVWGDITAANAMLSDCEITVDEFEGALELSEHLDAFNNGEWGPGHCDDL